jgi:hypothetical protein
MTTYENHKNIVKNLIEDIDEKIRSQNIIERQKIIGFAVSEASVNLIAILLRKNDLISSGFMINHRYFASKKRTIEKLPFDFNNKETIIDLLVNIEEGRQRLCYGKDKSKEEVEKAIKELFQLKKIIEKEIGEEI